MMSKEESVTNEVMLAILVGWTLRGMHGIMGLIFTSRIC